jgi:NADPH:quinone reductase-like Zn-dependent oxidoreductase
MKAFTISRYSKTDALQQTHMPDPIVLDNDVLVEIHAASVNLLDSKIKSGEFKLLLPYQFPLVLGHDVAGVVTQVGANVRRFKVGDTVYARPADRRIGAFAEFIAINESDVAHKPNNISMEEAASIPLGRFNRVAGTCRESAACQRAEGLYSSRFGRCGHVCDSIGKAFGRNRCHHGECDKCGLAQRFGRGCGG